MIEMEGDLNGKQHDDLTGKQHDPFQASKEQEQSSAATHIGSLKKIVALASIGTGVQTGWALQLSLLAPYVQLLGISHKWTSFIWLCGPISGIIVQPILGYQSDKCRSRWGRRRPFIAAGSFLTLVSIFLISFAVDFGRLFGDPLGSAKVKPRAIAIFVTGFWMLDFGNNAIQGPCRAFLADLAGKNHVRMRKANALFSFFFGVGNIVGYAVGSITNINKILPITKSKACDVDCANLKTCFFYSALLLLILTIFVMTYVTEKPLARSLDNGPDNSTLGLTEEEVEPTPVTSVREILKAILDLPRNMWVLLLVTCSNWVAWFPFLMYATDWMGKEVYGGEVGKGGRYQSGVRAGALGLMLNSVVLALTSLSLGFLTRMVGGVNRLWGCVNILLALCFGSTVLIAKLAESSRDDGGGLETHPELGIRLSALTLFAVLGIPLAVTFSIPAALAAVFSISSRAGQGVAIGVLNTSACVPQIVVSMASGPLDALFGGGNLPAFVLGGSAAVVSAVAAITMLPSLRTLDIPGSPISERKKLTKKKAHKLFSFGLIGWKEIPLLIFVSKGTGCLLVGLVVLWLCCKPVMSQILEKIR